MSGAAAAAAAAAARRAAERRKEEEEMTPYSEAELAGGWEFKIIRSSTPRFKKPEKLERLLAEEALAGWTLVEKFDDRRVRLKRPAVAREKDSTLRFDPYRTVVGMSEGIMTVLIVSLVLGACSVLFLLIFLLIYAFTA